MSWPRRTGLFTAHLHARLLRAVLLKYRELLAGLLQPDELVIVDELIAKCDEFLTEVPVYEPLP